MESFDALVKHVAHELMRYALEILKRHKTTAPAGCSDEQASASGHGKPAGDVDSSAAREREASPTEQPRPSSMLSVLVPFTREVRERLDRTDALVAELRDRVDAFSQQTAGSSLTSGMGKGQEEGDELAAFKDELLDAKRAEIEKWRGAASQFCGAHVGIPQDRCPACERDGLAWERDGLRSSLRAAFAKQGWMLEERMGGRKLYWCGHGNGCGSWTQPERGVRFLRQEDAQRVRDEHEYLRGACVIEVSCIEPPLEASVNAPTPAVRFAVTGEDPIGFHLARYMDTWVSDRNGDMEIAREWVELRRWIAKVILARSEPQLDESARDRWWCAALISTLSIDDIARVLKSLREIEGKPLPEWMEPAQVDVEELLDIVLGPGKSHALVRRSEVRLLIVRSLRSQGFESKTYPGTLP